MFTAFVALVAVLVIASYLRNERARRRALVVAKPRPIGELPEDTEGRIAGVTRAHGEPLAAPFSGRPCVYYTARVDRDVEADDGDRGPWSAIANEARAVWFLLEDDTGRALVEPTAAKVRIWFAPAALLERGDPRPPCVRELLERQRVVDPGGRLRYVEAMIEVGQTVGVFGAGIREPDPDAAPTADDRGEPPTRLRITSTPRHPIVISDDAPCPYPEPTPRTDG